MPKKLARLAYPLIALVAGWCLLGVVNFLVDICVRLVWPPCEGESYSKMENDVGERVLSGSGEATQGDIGALLAKHDIRFLWCQDAKQVETVRGWTRRQLDEWLQSLGGMRKATNFGLIVMDISGADVKREAVPERVALLVERIGGSCDVRCATYLWLRGADSNLIERSAVAEESLVQSDRLLSWVGGFGWQPTRLIAGEKIALGWLAKVEAHLERCRIKLKPHPPWNLGKKEFATRFVAGVLARMLGGQVQDRGGPSVGSPGLSVAGRVKMAVNGATFVGGAIQFAMACLVGGALARWMLRRFGKQRSGDLGCERLVVVLPTLGMLGTVLGLSGTVSAFELLGVEGGNELAYPAVTAQLALAFDTTVMGVLWVGIVLVLMRLEVAPATSRSEAGANGGSAV